MSEVGAPTPERTPTPPTSASPGSGEFLDRLRMCAARFGADLREGIDMPVLEVPRERWRELAEALRIDPDLRFDFCVSVTATDEFPEEPRFRVVTHLHSHAGNERVRLRCAVSSDAPVPSLAPIFPGANWMEREVFDLFGIRFEGHPDLRRILMPEEYGWHPLRKDFPIEGIEPDRLYREWERDRVAKRSSSG